MNEQTTPVIDRTIYPMPMFATFRVADLRAAETFYQAVGFVSLATVPGPGGEPAVIHLRRMRYQDILLVPGEAQPGSVTVSFAAGGEDLAERAAAMRSSLPAGATIDGPADTPWFTSDLTVTDPDGNRIILTAPRHAEMEEARRWASTFEGDFTVQD